MRSRWLHAPSLRAFRTDKSPSWLEILYDLIFVSAFVSLSSRTALALNSEHGFANLVLFGVVFSALWFSWTGFTFYSNRFDIDDFFHRTLIFTQILAVLGVATSASGILEGKIGIFSVCFGVVQALICVLYLRSYLRLTGARMYSAYWAKIFGVCSLIWFASALVPAPWTYALWFCGVAVLVGGPFAPPARKQFDEMPLDRDRLSRRYKFLTLIVLGGMFLQVMISLDAREGATQTRILMLACALVFTFSIWWLYFDDVASSSLRPRKFFYNYWLFTHLPMHAAIFTAGVALLRLMTLDSSTESLGATRWLLSLSVSTIFLVLAILDWLTDRVQARINGRVRIAARLVACAVGLILGSVGQGLTGAWFLASITLLCCSQVILDLSIAPNQPSPEGSTNEERLMADLAREAASKNMQPPRMRNAQEAIRKNTPRELQNDLYSYFIDASWPRFLAFIVFGYLLINLFFAGLYMLDPEGISNARPQSFADAFYFSVQTYATIGYGNLSPTTDFTNMLVVLEAAIGIGSVALITGVMFTKAAKPRPGILFSKPVIISNMNGKPTLAFRAGNTRGNEVVAAEISVSILKDEITVEGQHTRRIHDLNLVRSRSPFFVLSWVILHEINEQSPFYGLQSNEEIAKSILSLSCVLTGHDSTYGQTVYSRHVYYPEDIQIGSRFVDVTSQLPDGRIVLDYGKFHDTYVPVAPQQTPHQTPSQI